MATQEVSPAMPTSGAQVRRVKSAVHSDPLLLAELKRQTGMLKTITAILISFSVIVGISLLYGAIVLSGL